MQKYDKLKVNGVLLTQDAINKTREWYITNCQECIDGAINKDFFCNDIDSYVKYETEFMNTFINWDFSISLAFLQKAYYHQTGESVPILP